MISQEELINILERRDKLAKFLDIKTKKEKLALLDSKMMQNDFWNNPKEAEKILKDSQNQEENKKSEKKTTTKTTSKSKQSLQKTNTNKTEKIKSPVKKVSKK